ncbi:MAG: carboxypeptidase-like regulatory domain-containing protein, partial [Cellvibrionaceae bacterium]|nr:carboxypeptidase-like regulatory domain-containing protein [Cellvibrionaceae bacterium]
MFKLKTLAAAVALAASHAVIAGTVSGTVSDQDSTLPGANISLVGGNLKTTSDYQGKFTLNNVAAGRHQLRISYPGYEDQLLDIEVTETGHTNLPSTRLSIAGGAIEEVTVLGHIVRGEMKALATQRNSDRIINVIAADGIGKLPDRNAAEAVQRVPGVSIERDQGEGRFVAVRGLPSQWSSSSLNGNRLPTAEEETTSRATAFDFFPTEMIEFVEVSKAVTPDMEGDAIGGNVNFVTRTAPTEQIFNVALGSGYNEKSGGRNGYNANILYGDVSEDGRFGYLINATAWERDWATDNYEPRRGNDGLGIRRLELRDYTGVRTTYGVNAAAEYNFDGGDQVYFRAQYGTLEDDETHYKHRNRFDKDRVEVQHIHNVLITEMTAFEFGGEHLFGDSASLDWKLASFENDFRYGDAPGGGDNAYFVMRFDQKNVGFTGLENRVGKNYAYNTIDGGSDPADAISNHLPQGFAMDPSQTRLAWVELYKVDVNEKDNIVAELNWT